MKMKYIGKGAWLVGVPARDLSADEVKHYGQDKLIASGLYMEFSKKPKAEKPAEDLQTEEA